MKKDIGEKLNLIIKINKLIADIKKKSGGK